MKVLAAMSGGVDSAVAAARAVDAGHEVVGVHLALSRNAGTLRTGARGCCTIEDSMDAQRVSAILGIKYFVWDFSERFKMEVVDDFIQEYEAGRTPNPCMRCNERIKFAALLEKALALGFDAVCTGHYATIEEHDGNLELHRSPATAKDQSYVLGVLTTEQLKHALFPIGAESDKADIRKEAEARGLAVAQKPDSYDICFIPDGDTQGWLGEKLNEQPGQIVDRNGNVLSDHTGTHNYTVGQRKGLSIEKPAKDGRPRYVLEIRPKTKTVVVGPQEALAIKELGGTKFTWCGQAPTNPEIPFEAEVQVRAHAEPVTCTAQLDEGELKVITHEPILGVAPGQTAVIYLGTRVLGQFTIDRTVSAVPVEVNE
ncbi:MAG: tRNA 2-thiouridine(34) synthase MnmA [Rhodoluna sp.]|nr:tRNA 2-thiouridine(34) synthase MnmA [Rhodoluna sp.]